MEVHIALCFGRLREKMSVLTSMTRLFRSPTCPWRTSPVLSQAIFFLVLAGIGDRAIGQDREEKIALRKIDRGVVIGIPQPVTEENFTALKRSSPFSRSLDPSESVVLTGVARIEGKLYVTVFEKEKEVTRIVSDASDPEGWKLVEMAGNEEELETVTAKVSIMEGESFSVKYGERQLRPAGVSTGRVPGAPPAPRPPRPDRDFREGVSGDGFRGAPPPEIMKKLSMLKEDDRNRLIQQIGQLRDRGVGSEERRGIFQKMVDEAFQQRR